jgi:hypothetical protein
LPIFFDDELTTFRNKHNRFICNVEKNEKGLMGCEKDIQVLHKTGIFKHLFNSRRFLASFMFDYIFYSF